jgi:hypothetical protein
MILRGTNISFNLHESMNYVVIRQITSESALNFIVCVCVCACLYTQVFSSLSLLETHINLYITTVTSLC